MAAETRPVSGFDRVALRGYGDLHIIQGETESLTIEAGEEMLKNIRTSVEGSVLRIDVVEDWAERVETFLNKGFESQKIRYDLSVKVLTGLEVSGAARVRMDGLETPSLEIRLGGAADIQFQGINAERAVVELPGTGSIRAAGKVKEQQVTVSGAGMYSGRRLESQQARVRLSGAGRVAVWVEQELEVNISGLGAVQVYGSPRVKESVRGLGTVQMMGSPG